MGESKWFPWLGRYDGGIPEDRRQAERRARERQTSLDDLLDVRGKVRIEASGDARCRLQRWAAARNVLVLWCGDRAVVEFDGTAPEHDAPRDQGSERGDRGVREPGHRADPNAVAGRGPDEGCGVLHTGMSGSRRRF